MGRAICVIGLGFGDESKGATTEAFVRSLGAKLVVRYNGGPQAAHAVVDGRRHHVFAQFGSGSLAGARTYLSKFMLLDPARLLSEAILLEAVGLTDPFAVLDADGRAPLVTPAHKLANRARELARGAARHGSTGMGIWETARLSDSIGEAAPRVRDLRAPPGVLASKLDHVRNLLLADLRDLTLDAAAAAAVRQLQQLDVTWFESMYRSASRKLRVVDEGVLREALRAGDVVFEGAQGVLLDADVGFHPHVSGTRTTTANFKSLLSECGHVGQTDVVGVTRCYTTRHGPGPLPTELASPPVAEGHNKATSWAGRFRCGTLDLVLLRYSMAVSGGVSSLAVSHLDLWPLFRKTCVRYEATKEAAGYLSDDGRELAVPRSLVGEELWRRQSAAAAALSACRPVLETAARLEEMLELELGVPVTVRAYGPEYKDRVLVTKTRS